MSAGTAAGPHPKTYDFSDPRLECDIIMKGGVTSGVIYPWAVCEIATTYRFRCVGGTSAGAIAAAATAAAEYGRATGGFEVLADLPEWLGADDGKGHSRLFSLFQPQSSTRGIYRTLVSGVGKKGAWRGIALAASAVRWFWPSAVAGSLVGLFLVAVSLNVAGPLGWIGMLLAIALAVVGAVAGAGARLAWHAASAIPANAFGLCRGFSPATPGDDQLTAWLDRTISDAAGIDGGPLTFGQLWEGPDGTGSGSDKRIQLEMMTTDVTEGLPVQLPCDGRSFYFDPAELRAYFPEHVVRWMETRPASLEGLDVSDRRDAVLERRQLEPLRPMPAPEDVPVVVAARMSLSFPLLISAVPLHAIDWSRDVNKVARGEARSWIKAHPDATDDEVLAGVRSRVFATRHWFSDGGVCSNFPVHLFDAPLPSRPTFALNLRGFHPDHSDPETEAEKVYLPKDNSEGYRRWQYEIAETGAGGLVDFLGAVVKTMQNWQDNSLLPLAGYRDRIVHVSLSGEEGGTNLDMRAPEIELLAGRGRLAGEALVDQFAGDAPGVVPTWGWTNHRWTRYRVALAELQGWLSAFTVRFQAAGTPDTPAYVQIVEPGFKADSHGFDWPSAAEKSACKATTDLVGFVDGWPDPEVDLSQGAPRTRPVMRLVWRPGRK